ncbi:MAG: LysR family transcriptional regulator ArgP [Acinetobacter populi]|jgi:LysR family transcriptional regulator (chromosome initiation inhibitor)|uniref:LysR family transcriptional regulator ArgP n=1 Tax=Acinetobacter populi TaxID=1582270 RepID=UPI00235343F9|nr:LysR family transcriptional regulator ArgP [Acinetobacter populi]MCH4246688.1 LysR family transcriptional regulator ArgP [Acinetobacter populi]
MFDKKQCDAFLAVIKTGSFESAAKELFLTAAAISLRVQAFEQALGTLLINRTRPCTPTQAGIEVVQYLQHAKLREQKLLHDLKAKTDNNFFKVRIGSNADSLATWLLPAINQTLIQHHLVADIHVDDQSRTYALLETGLVHGCISTKISPMHGCEAIFLGNMRYKMVATPNFVQKWFAHGITREALRLAPAVIFNDKDHLHFEVMQNRFGLTQNSYPCSTVPASISFVRAIRLGLGYGMVPELQLNELAPQSLIELYQHSAVDVALYWHHWQQQSLPLQELTRQLVVNARHYLAHPEPQD